VSESFVQRWSRLKRVDRARQNTLTPQKTETAIPSPPAEEEAANMPRTAPVGAESDHSPPAPRHAGGEATVGAQDETPLPPLESLTKDSDFAAFLRPGVPEELRQAALRKLWRSDPAWAGPEALDLHNLDYTLPGVPEIVRTAYQIGKGYLEALDEAAAPPAPSATSSEAHEEPREADLPPTDPAHRQTKAGDGT
jgi:hypothetical protein